MKKKAKLIATLSSLGLALAMMVFAVYAATSVTFKVTTNVSFEATKHVQATILAMHTGALEDEPTETDYNTDDVTGANQTIGVNPDGTDNGTLTDVVFGARELTATKNHYGYKIEITNNDNENDLPISVTLPKTQSGTGYEVNWGEMPTTIAKNGGKATITCHIEVTDLAGNTVTVKNEDMAINVLLGVKDESAEEELEPTLEYLTFEFVENGDADYYTVALNADKINGVSTLSEYGVTLLEETEFNGNIIIPDYYDDMEHGKFIVKEMVGVDYGEDLTKVKNVILPETIEYIGGLAFHNCNINSLTIPASVKSIGGSVFIGSCYIYSIMFLNPETIVDNYTFMQCSSIVEIIGHETRTENSFIHHNGPESLLYKENGVFYYNDNENNEIYACGTDSNYTQLSLKDGVTVLCKQAFDNCDLTSITIPSSVNNIQEETFSYHYQLAEVINKSNLLITAGSTDFGCVGYFAVIVHNGDNSLLYENDGVIYYDDTINNRVYACGPNMDRSNITIKTGTTDIKDHAFSSCDSLETITIPDSVTTIGKFAFTNCFSLTIYCEAEAQPTTWASEWNLGFNGKVYYAGQWSYDAEGNPVPNA